MGKMTITFSDDLERQLRDHVKQKYAGKKGALSIVVEEAVRDYFKVRQSN